MTSEGDFEGGHSTAVGELSLDEKAALTGGADAWHTMGVPRLDVPALRLTDGPSGARGIRYTGEVATSLPCGTALAASWNRFLVGQVGRVLGDEARSKGADVLLAPTVNVHRHPLAGRNFECFSEDPYLSSQVADAYIRGVQSRGVGCAVKHLVANDQEHDRLEISVDVDERTLREIYLPAFETAVRNSGVWAVMTAYNRLYGTYCSEHTWLLDEVLRQEWGFDGVVMSDWFGTRTTLALAAGLDLEMPGPARFLGHHVASAVHQGDLAEPSLNRSADNLLRLAHRVRTDAHLPAADPSASATALQAATEAIVLLRNDGVLPLDPERHRSVAVVGPNAERPDIQGEGSAYVDPPYIVTPLEGISVRAEAAGVTARHDIGVALRPPTVLGHAELGGGRLRVDYFDGADSGSSPDSWGDPVISETVPRTRLFWTGCPAEGLSAPSGATVRASADFVPDRSGRWRLALTSAGAARVGLDHDLVLDNLRPEPGISFFGHGSTAVTSEVLLEAGRSYRLVMDLFIAPDRHWGASGIELTAQPPELAGALDAATHAAASADVAIVVVGEDGNSTEGSDRSTMDLPTDQVDLVRAVAAVNPATVVVVNTAAPVTMDWVPDVAAVVQLWYLGQETGRALAAVLFGDEDASGRLPTTFPARLEDTPAYRMFPGAGGRVHYGEGVMVGYRHYDAADVEPLFCFGHGLSYTEFSYTEPQVAVREANSRPTANGPVSLTGREGEDVVVDVELEVTNVGDRRGREVVQLYVHDEQASVHRPEQELKAFGKLDLAPGETDRVHFELGWRAFAFWDARAHRWTLEPGRYELRVGSSSRAIHHVAQIDL